MRSTGERRAGACAGAERRGRDPAVPGSGTWVGRPRRSSLISGRLPPSNFLALRNRHLPRRRYRNAATRDLCSRGRIPQWEYVRRAELGPEENLSRKVGSDMQRSAAEPGRKTADPVTWRLGVPKRRSDESHYHDRFNTRGAAVLPTISPKRQGPPRGQPRAGAPERYRSSSAVEKRSHVSETCCRSSLRVGKSRVTQRSVTSSSRRVFLGPSLTR
jgi:hypothetical protein